MPPFHQNVKAPTEMLTGSSASPTTNKNTDASVTANQAGVNGAPTTAGSVPGQKHPDSKHHFWQHKYPHNDDHAQQMDYLKSRGYDEEHARQAVENVESNWHDNRHRKKSLADKILGPLPAEDDSVGKGNLGQGLVWRS